MKLHYCNSTNTADTDHKMFKLIFEKCVHVITPKHQACFQLIKTRGPRGPWGAHLRKRSKVKSHSGAIYRAILSTKY